MTAKKVGMMLGIVFILVGLLGFLGGFGIVGMNGIFVTNTAHDLVHLVTGLLFVIVAMKAPSSMSMVLKVFGVVYLLVALLGFFMTSDGMLLGFLAVNHADHWLHVILALVVLGAGFMTSNRNTMMNGGGMM